MGGRSLGQKGHLEACPLACTGLFLHGHDLHDLILEGGPQEVLHDLVLLHRHGEQVDLLQALDLPLRTHNGPLYSPSVRMHWSCPEANQEGGEEGRGGGFEAIVASGTYEEYSIPSPIVPFAFNTRNQMLLYLVAC